MDEHAVDVNNKSKREYQNRSNARGQWKYW